VIAVADASGASLSTNRYDEYGVGQASNAGRFGYTGQQWLPELGLNYYKARLYRPAEGVFMQTDPIGYDGGINLYAYVGDDPLNLHDPEGQAAQAIVALGKWGWRLYRYSGNVGRATKEIAREFSTDWHALDDDAGTSVGDKLRASSDLIFGTRFYNEIYDHDRGKIKNPSPERVPVGDDEIDDAIGELEQSIERRKSENNQFPRGNPNSPDPEMRRRAQLRQGHLDRIAREERVLERLRERKRLLDKE
jgi:RHS repeat-associated protein